MDAKKKKKVGKKNKIRDKSFQSASGFFLGLNSSLGSFGDKKLTRKKRK